MAELMFGLGQTKKKKESEAKIKYTKAHLKDVTITETMESNVRSDQHDRDQKYKETKRRTKKNLKDVTQEETGEMAIRKQHADREKRWKQTGRNQVKTNSKFDMARSLFGGGGPAPTANHDEEHFSEEEYVEEEIADNSDEYVEEGIIEE
jgi:hypothetical protein